MVQLSHLCAMVFMYQGVMTVSADELALQCESKNPPCCFLNFFPKRLGIFNQFFTHLLHDHFYTRVQILFKYLQLNKVMPY